MSNDLPIFLLIAAFMGAVMLLMPHLSPSRYFFAITVTPNFRSTAAGRASLRRYYAAVVCSVIITAVLIVRLGRGWPNLTLVLPLGPTILGGLAFLWERRQVAAQAPPVYAIREAELSTEDDHLPRWIALMLLPFAFPLAAAQWLRARWNEIPQRVPTHWDIHNQVDNWADKSAHTVYGPVLYAGGMMLIMILLTLAMFYGSRRGRQRTAVVKMMVATIYFLALLLSGVALMPLMPNSSALIWVPAVLFPVVLLVWVYKVMSDPEMPAETTPDECWYLGNFYVNAQDPAIFVQKRVGFGYTINMGNRLGWLIMVGFLAAIAALIFVLPQ